MVDIIPMDNLDDVDCRWLIKGWGLIFGKDLDRELKKYFKEEKREVSE